MKPVDSADVNTGGMLFRVILMRKHLLGECYKFVNCHVL